MTKRYTVRKKRAARKKRESRKRIKKRKSRKRIKKRKSRKRIKKRRIRKKGRTRKRGGGPYSWIHGNVNTLKEKIRGQEGKDNEGNSTWKEQIERTINKKYHLGKNALKLPGRVDDFYGIMGELTKEEWRNLKAAFIDLAEARKGDPTENEEKWGVFNAHFDSILDIDAATKKKKKTTKKENEPKNKKFAEDNGKGLQMVDLSKKTKEQEVKAAKEKAAKEKAAKEKAAKEKAAKEKAKAHQEQTHANIMMGKDPFGSDLLP